MDINLYQQLAEKTAIYPKEMGLYYTTLGLVGEAGEIANKVKKIIRDDNGELSFEKRVELVSELGDVLWYVANLASELKVDLDKVASTNINKLFGRKDRGALQGSGDDR